MGRRPQVWRRVCTIAADFQVSDTGKVKLIDPTGQYRLRYVEACGHKAFTFLGRLYFVADLVARAHLGRRTGFINFVDGDKQNPRANNLIISDTETQTSLMPENMPASRVKVLH